MTFTVFYTRTQFDSVFSRPHRCCYRLEETSGYEEPFHPDDPIERCCFTPGPVELYTRLVLGAYQTQEGRRFCFSRGYKSREWEMTVTNELRVSSPMAYEDRQLFAQNIRAAALERPRTPELDELLQALETFMSQKREDVENIDEQQQEREKMAANLRIEEVIQKIRYYWYLYYRY